MDSRCTLQQVAIPFINNCNSFLDPVGYLIPDCQSSSSCLFIPHPPGYPSYLDTNSCYASSFFSEFHSYSPTHFKRHTVLRPLLFVFFFLVCPISFMLKPFSSRSIMLCISPDRKTVSAAFGTFGASRTE